MIDVQFSLENLILVVIGYRRGVLEPIGWFAKRNCAMKAPMTKTVKKENGMVLAVRKCMDYGPANTNALNGQYVKKGLQSNDTIVRFLSLENFWRMVNSR